MARNKEDAVITGPELYEQDFALWIEEQVGLLRSKAFDRLDLANLIDEMEGMSRSDRRKLENNLIVVIKHLLKHEFQPAKRTRSWLGSIREHRRRVLQILEDSPSLKMHLDHTFSGLHREAREQAMIETGLSPKRFPATSPYTLEQVLDPDFLPD